MPLGSDLEKVGFTTLRLVTPWQLARAVRAAGADVVEALRRWEPVQLELGRQVLARARRAGERLQFEGAWQVGEALAIGLYRAGDSTLDEA